MSKVAEKVESIFGKRPIVGHNNVRVNVEKLKSSDLFQLHMLGYKDDVKDINIKRSGSGITVMIDTF